MSVSRVHTFIELSLSKFYYINVRIHSQDIDDSIDDFGDDDDDDVRITKKTRKRKKRGSIDDDDDDPPVVYPKKKRAASSVSTMDKASEAKLKRQLKKIMDIVIKYADR